MAYGAWVEFAAKAGQDVQLAKVLTEMAVASRAEEGCLAYDVFRVKDSSNFRLFEAFRDEAALAFHREAAHYLRFREDVAPLLAEAIGVMRLEVVDWGGGSA